MVIKDCGPKEKESLCINMILIRFRSSTMRRRSVVVNQCESVLLENVVVEAAKHNQAILLINVDGFSVINSVFNSFIILHNGTNYGYIIINFSNVSFTADVEVGYRIILLISTNFFFITIMVCN